MRHILFDRVSCGRKNNLLRREKRNQRHKQTMVKGGHDYGD